jgi:predicted dehydrogenase
MKIAFAGTGGINKVHARAARSLGLELSAVVNHRPESMAAFAKEFGIPRGYETLEALLKDGDLDALVVSTPNYLHAPQTIAALNAGVHVMVEKPMAMNAREAEQMCEAAEKSGSLLMVAHCWRFHPEVQWLKGQSSRLGKIVRTKAYSVHVHWGPAGWFAEKQFAGGGAMADVGIHGLDTTRYLLGDPQPVSVYARIGTFYGSYDVDDTGVVMIEWDNGTTSYIETGWWQPHSDSPEGGAQLYGLKGFGSVFPTRLELANEEEHKIDVIDGGFGTSESHQPQSLYDAQLMYFVECVEKNRTPVPGGSEGWTNMKVVDAAYESSRTRKVVEIR